MNCASGNVIRRFNLLAPSDACALIRHYINVPNVKTSQCTAQAYYRQGSQITALGTPGGVASGRHLGSSLPESPLPCVNGWIVSGR